MALAVTVQDIAAGGPLGIRVVGTIVASGNYTTGGDAWDLASLARLVRKQPRMVRIQGINGYHYSYNRATKKLMVHTTANTELAGAPTAYPAGVTGDTIQFEAWFTK